MQIRQRLLVALAGFSVGFGAVVPWWILHWADMTMALAQGIAVGILSGLVWPTMISRPVGKVATVALVFVLGVYVSLSVLILTSAMRPY